MNIQLLAEEILKLVPLDNGEIDMSMRYSEKGNKVSMELLFPTGRETVLNLPQFQADEISLAIVRGLSENLMEVVEDNYLGPRIKVKMDVKMKTK